LPLAHSFTPTDLVPACYFSSFSSAYLFACTVAHLCTQTHAASPLSHLLTPLPHTHLATPPIHLNAHCLASCPLDYLLTLPLSCLLPQQCLAHQKEKTGSTSAIARSFMEEYAQHVLVLRILIINNFASRMQHQDCLKLGLPLSPKSYKILESILV